VHVLIPPVHPHRHISGILKRRDQLAHRVSRQLLNLLDLDPANGHQFRHAEPTSRD